MHNMKLILDDCMNVMKQYSDKYFDLAIVDPPYGIYNENVSGFMKQRKGTNNVKWDIKPNKLYFDYLFRISKNQIIWGGNYFLEYLGNTKEPIIWDKKNGTNFFSDGEFAWSSFNGTLRIFRHQWCGYFRDSEKGYKNFHPTGKPIMLYKWCLKKYAKPDYKIIDTHLGSGSHAIAWHYYQKDGEFVGIEIDKEYFEAAKKRIEKNTRQLEFEGF